MRETRIDHGRHGRYHVYLSFTPVATRADIATKDRGYIPCPVELYATTLSPHVEAPGANWAIFAILDWEFFSSPTEFQGADTKNTVLRRTYT